MTKINLLKVVLCLGALYYLLGGIAHYFGLTIFPFFDANLYTPYQDNLLAYTAFFFVLLLLVVARDPVKNIDVLNAIILGAFMASVLSILIIWKVDFAAIGAPGKKLQTIVEGLMGFAFTGALYYLRPKNN